MIPPRVRKGGTWRHTHVPPQPAGTEGPLGLIVLWYLGSCSAAGLFLLWLASVPHLLIGPPGSSVMVEGLGSLLPQLTQPLHQEMCL